MQSSINEISEKAHQGWMVGDGWAEIFSWIKYGWTYKLPRWLGRLFPGRQQARFFRALEEAGVGVIRGPGKRYPFLDRLQKHGSHTLGLGPAGRLLAPYIQRREDAPLRRKMDELISKRGSDYGVLISGEPGAGKTRTALELIAGLQPAYVLTWSEAIGAAPDFPRWNGKGIVFFDNLGKTGGETIGALPASLLYLLERAPNLLLVGTIRTEQLSEDPRRLALFELKPTGQDHPGLSEFFETIARSERAAGLETSAEEVRGRFHGHPAGPVAAVGRMAALYGRLEPIEQAALRAIKLLGRIGIGSLDRLKVKEAADLVQGEKCPEDAFRAVLESLDRKGWISWRPAEDRLEAYESYLEHAVDLPGTLLELRQNILECWRERGDGEALFRAANACSDIHAEAYRQEPRKALLEAISLYKEALAFTTEGRSPLEYARIQNYLGAAYQNLARYQDSQENLEKAIRAHGQALRFRTKARCPFDHAQTLSNLGVARQNLARHQQPQENLEKAIQVYRQVLEFYTEERAPLDHARIHNNLGVAYQDLAGYQQPQENLEKARRAYCQALQFYTEERAPLTYAMIQNNLGSVYQVMARQADSEENMAKAIHAYTEALRLFSPEQAIGRRAEVRDRLRKGCYRLGLWFRTQRRPEEAIAQFEKAMQLSATIGSTLNLAGIYKQMGQSIAFMKYIYLARQIIGSDDWYNLACIESLEGNPELAFEHLRRAGGEQRLDRKWAWVDPDFEELRKDPRFEEIVGPMPRSE